MKVLMLVSSLDSYRVGATDGFITDWVRVLASKVEKLTVLTYHFNPREKFAANTKIAVISGNNFLTRNINLVIKTLKLAKDNDIIFAHILEIFGIAGGITGKILRKKSFLWYCQPYDISHNYLAKVGFFLNDKILTCGRELKERYVRLIGGWVNKKIVTIGHGIYFPHYLSGQNIKWPSDTQTKVKILYAGRVSPIKDIPTLQKAVKLLSNRVTLDIVTNYSYVQNPTVFKTSNIFVNSSKGFSLDKTLLEALACGVIAIGSENTYPFLKKKFPQLAFKSGDCQDLAQKISWLINNPKGAMEITNRAKEFVSKNFDLNKLMDRIVDNFISNKI